MDPQKMMGYTIPADRPVSIPARDYHAMKLALWRSKAGWEIAMREAKAILDRCAHLEGCPAKNSETEQCFGAIRYDSTEEPELGCPDRELRMSALVVLNAGRMFAPVDARRISTEPYVAPSREYFSEVIATLVTAQAELEAFASLGGHPPIPPPQLKEST